MGIRHTPRVFGLMQTSHVDEAYLLKLLEHLPPGDSEVYSHPSTEAKYQKEFSALTSSKRPPQNEGGENRAHLLSRPAVKRLNAVQGTPEPIQSETAPPRV
jgi:hypothetical protein